MHVKEIYVIFIHVFDSGILLIIELNKKKGKNRESIRDATAELQVKFIWSNWIPVFKIYQCYVPSINLLALLVHKKKIFKY
jgi:hypothetical protein